MSRYVWRKYRLWYSNSPRNRFKTKIACEPHVIRAFRFFRRHCSGICKGYCPSRILPAAAARPRYVPLALFLTASFQTYTNGEAGKEQPINTNLIRVADEHPLLAGNITQETTAKPAHQSATGSHGAQNYDHVPLVCHRDIWRGGLPRAHRMRHERGTG